MNERRFYPVNVGKYKEVTVRRKCELVAKLLPFKTGTLKERSVGSWKLQTGQLNLGGL
jgi:hypothetical protein